MTNADFLAGRRLRRAAVLALGLGLAGLPAAQAGTWDDAQAAFADLDDRRGLQQLAQAAHEGDARAMHAWALALKHGPRLFPGVLRADAAQSAQWFDKLARHCVLQRAQPDGVATGAGSPVSPISPACPGAPSSPSSIVRTRLP